MSWAEEDWTVGLSGRVLQKVKELQVHQERLIRENKQKQLQLDNIHISLEKQTVKYDKVRAELQSLQRELQCVREEAKTTLTSKERLNQELQTKQAQVCSLEGQLDAVRAQNNKLAQEIKRLEAELEKLQNSSKATETSLFSTPCWNPSPYQEHQGSRQEESLGLRDGQGRAHQGRQLQFSDRATPLLPRPHSTPFAGFPWERDESTPAARRRLVPSPQTQTHYVTNQEQGVQRDCGTHSRIEADEMRSRVADLEEALLEQTKTLKCVQTEQVQTKKELAAKELSLQSSHGELTAALARLTQEKDRVSATEHRLKQLQEELKCQRQNAESSRLQHQQRTKELEKQHQRDVSELQKERQFLEKQHQQEVNKLNQELQQAAALHNALQAKFDKLSLQKQLLDKEFESLKAKLKWTEEQLKESQKKETHLQAKLMETGREVESVTVSLEQSRKRERALEEEGKRLAEELADALRQVKELQGQKSISAVASQPVQFCPAGECSSFPSSFPHSARPSTKKAASQQKGGIDEEAAYKRSTEQRNLYSSDREPGEGIDSEHIAVSSVTDSENKTRNESMTSDISVSNKNVSSLSSSISEKANREIDFDNSPLPQPPGLSTEKTPLLSEQSVLSQDLKKENDMLRSELQDVREELQKRLQDLEGQRRAEAEARTRLKQISRKHANQSTENEEKNKEWRAQFERERAEAERLRKTVAALEADLKREKELRKESGTVEEDREDEMIEFNIQLKKELAEVKAQLALEQEERKQEQDNRNHKTSSNMDVKEEENSKVAELTAEVEELRCRVKKLKERENLSADNSALKYLGLRNDEINSNVVFQDNTLLTSPEQHQLICQSINKHNMLVSAGKTFEDEETMIELEPSSFSDEDATDQLTSDLDDLSLSELTASDLSEVEHLKIECKKQTERATQAQVKLEALQRQVTRQTQQLTAAFEKQSLHISGLLAELQDKESVILSQGEELLQYKEELQAVKSTKECNDINHFPNYLDKNSLNPTGTENSPEGGIQDHEESKPVQRSDKHPDLDSSKIGDGQHFQIGGQKDLLHEIVTVQQDDPRSKEKRADFNVPVCKNQPQSCIETQVTGSSVKTCVQEQETQNQQGNFRPEKQEPTSSVKGSCDDMHILERIDDIASGAEELLVQESGTEVNNLQQEVVALQMKVKALLHKAQQQAEELAIWKLSSQPAPTFNTLELPDAQEPHCAVSLQQIDLDEGIQSQAQAQTHTLEPLCRQDNITVIREDELLLSCSSMKLQGRLLYSRLEPKNLRSSETTPPQEFNQDPANDNQESQNENLGGDASHHSEASSSIQLKGNAEQIQMTLSVQPCVAKDSHKDSEVGRTQRRTSDEACDNEASGKSLRSISSQTDEALSLGKPPNVSVATQTQEGDKDKVVVTVESPSGSHVALPDGAESQQALLFSGPFPIPADPARLAERIRRNRTQLSAAFDDTEYEPYGLPEVVMKGFADIPSGPSCPYIVRRGLLGTTVVPMAEKEDEMD